MGDGLEKPKAVARLALKGDENISSVSVTRDGGLLAVATVREVRLFQLVETTSEVGSGLRIRKLEIPSTVGARIVRFTPDGRWLAIITPTDDIFSARVVRGDDPLDRPRVLPKLFPLHRLPRERLPSDPLNGDAGEYGRAVTHAEFSTDGTVFAVADLAGYIDTWVTEGHEDPTAPEVDVEEAANASMDDDDSDDDEEDVKEHITLLGQRWIRNPSAQSFPRLDSAPALLSFQPTPHADSRPEPNGNPAVHPTRNNPHPHSHDISDTEHRLLLVSADRQLYLFDVLAGHLSEWSRRNPPSIYPSKYRNLKSSAKGCIWDVAEQQRVWIYGEDWMFMFDLAGDLPIPETVDASDVGSGADGVDTTNAKKRKREAKARKGKSGAGDAVPERDAPVTKMRKYQRDEEDPMRTQTTLHDARMTAESDGDSDTEQNALIKVRRQDSAANGMPNGNGITKSTDLITKQDADGEVVLQEQKPERWWHTFKYRPVLGIVPIGGTEGEPLEVVLVERPSWDLDLPPKFMGAHEG
jgi:U3 small nucleolar RNA-associated protein 4